MTIDRFEVPGLAQYSYIVSSEGRSVVIDPSRDTDRYVHFHEQLPHRFLTVEWFEQID